jgi:hypothetical protein
MLTPVAAIKSGTVAIAHEDAANDAPVSDLQR